MERVLFDGDLNSADSANMLPTGRCELEKHVILNKGINVGNKVFVTSVLQYLTKPEIDLDIKPIFSISPEEASEKYDYIVAAYANIFYVDTDEYFVNKTKWIKKLKIPFYVIGCGIQCENLEQIKTMKKNIGNSVAEFISAVENTGGAVATRGYITKEFLDKCCKNSAVATGCPSFYRRGRSFLLKKEDVSRDDFNVAFTSYNYPKRWIERQFMKYPNSGFIDQGVLFSEYFQSASYKRFIDSLYEKYGKSIIEDFFQGRIYTPIDIPCWEKQFGRYTYSYGSRLHGCSMSLYSYTPAKLICTDLRCKEVADYFGIPSDEKYDSSLDLYEDYLSLDLDIFNHKYQHGYNVFAEFIESNGISYNIDDSGLWEKRISEESYEDIILLDRDEVNQAKNYYDSFMFIVYNNILTKYTRKVLRRINA